MIKCKRRVTRETGFVDDRTRRAIVLTLETGGRLVLLRLKGTRKAYPVAVKDIWLLAGKIEAQAMKLQKIAKQKERQQQRKALGG